MLYLPNEKHVMTLSSCTKHRNATIANIQITSKSRMCAQYSYIQAVLYTKQFD